MSAGLLWGVQTALYSLFTGDSTLTDLLADASSVYDSAPDNATHPYIVIGDAVETPWNTIGAEGRDVVSTVHVWSRYEGMKEVAAIMSRIAALVDDGSSLTVAGWDTIKTEYEGGNTLRDPDGVTRHGVVSIRVRAFPS